MRTNDHTNQIIEETKTEEGDKEALETSEEEVLETSTESASSSSVDGEIKPVPSNGFDSLIKIMRLLSPASTAQLRVFNRIFGDEEMITSVKRVVEEQKREELKEELSSKLSLDELRKEVVINRN